MVNSSFLVLLARRLEQGMLKTRLQLKKTRIPD